MNGKFLYAAGVMLLLSGCGGNRSNSYDNVYYPDVSPQDEAACELQVAQILGPPRETLTGTLDQIGPRKALMQKCYFCKGYKPWMKN